MFVIQPMPMPVWIDRPCGEDRPRVDAEAGFDRQGAAGPVEEEADEELDHSACHAPIQSHYWTVS